MSQWRFQATSSPIYTILSIADPVITWTSDAPIFFDDPPSYYNLIECVSGTKAGSTYPVIAYDNVAKTLTTNMMFTLAPAPGDKFKFIADLGGGGDGGGGG